MGIGGLHDLNQDKPLPLTNARFANFPADEIARAVAATPTHPIASAKPYADPDLAKAREAFLSLNRGVPPERPDGRRKHVSPEDWAAFHSAVISFMEAARANGAPNIREAVAKRWGIPSETAKKYIREARAWVAEGHTVIVPPTSAAPPAHGGRPWAVAKRTGPIDADDIAALNALVSSPEHQKRTGRSPGKNSTARKDA